MLFRQSTSKVGAENDSQHKCQVNLGNFRLRPLRQPQPATPLGPLTSVKLELLLHVTRLGVPDNGSFVDASTEQKITLLVPLEGKYWPLVFSQLVRQLACVKPSNRQRIARLE